MTLSRTRPAAGVFLVLAAACAGDGPPLQPESPAPPAPEPLAELTCTFERADMSLTCEPAGATPGAASGDLVLGGQNVFVTLASSNRVYDSGTGLLTADVTLENLILQRLGTTDGLNVDPSGIRVFFQSGPTVTSGSGAVSVLVPSPNDSTGGVGTFTAAAQPYWQYNEVLSQAETSSPREWSFDMPSTVSSFVFTVFVSAPVQYPDGWLDLSSTAVTVAPGAADTLTAVSRDAVGRPISETITWSTANASVATVTQAGVITGVAEGSTIVTATTPTHGPTDIPVSVIDLVIIGF